MHSHIIATLLYSASALGFFADAHANESTLWNVRYVLFVDSVQGFRLNALRAKQENLMGAKSAATYLNADELITSPKIFFVPGMAAIATRLLRFDREGHVTSDQRLLTGLQGKIENDNMVLASPSQQDLKPYYFADWNRSDSEPSHFLPAPCTQRDYFRYSRPWDYDSPAGGFGCREWTAQLYRQQRPYIDVTTYTARRNFIGKFLGWSRYTDTPKPVIGMHGRSWLCLHDCPAGERPGIIPDIRAWTRKHGFPVPVCPAIQPEYPSTETDD